MNNLFFTSSFVMLRGRNSSEYIVEVSPEHKHNGLHALGGKAHSSADKTPLLTLMRELSEELRIPHHILFTSFSKFVLETVRVHYYGEEVWLEYYYSAASELTNQQLCASAAVECAFMTPLTILNYERKSHALSAAVNALHHVYGSHHYSIKNQYPVPMKLRRVKPDYRKSLLAGSLTALEDSISDLLLTGENYA